MNHRKILLIDDDADDQLIFLDALNEVAGGIECVTANDGVSALNILKSNNDLPSMIFLDLNMPMMNGLDCLKFIKGNATLQHIPVVIFTTSENPADKKNTSAFGAQVYFTKTADFKFLKAKLVEILHNDFAKNPFLLYNNGN